MEKTDVLMQMETDEDVSTASLTPQPHRLHRIGAAALVIFSVLVLVLVFVVPGKFAAPQKSVILSKDLSATENFFEKVPSKEYPDPCGSYPYVRLRNVTHSNLGNKGPDKGREGIEYQGRVHHVGLEEQFLVTLNAKSDYQPSWPKENGYKNYFGQINVKQGTNVSLTLGVYNMTSKEKIVVPRFVLTVFDLDQGKENRSVEFFTIANFKKVWLSNETELTQTDNDDGSSTFTATVEGSGTDNPTNPLALTPLQKNRAVTFEFEDLDEVPFTFGASSGHTTRVFMFAIRPSLLCAYTKLPDGTLVNATDLEKSPVHVVIDDDNLSVKGLAIRPHNGRQVILIAVGFLWMVMQQFHF